MPKPFHIAIEVEEVALGKVIRALNSMPGIARLHLDLEADSSRRAALEGPNGRKLLPPPTRKPAGDVLILAIMNGSDSAKQLTQALAAYGYGKTAFSYHARIARDAGHVRSTGRGTYGLTAKGKSHAQALIVQR